MMVDGREIRRDRRGERGAVMAMTAISLLAILLIMGLAIDISHFYAVKTELQNAADASALAGASALDSTPAGINLAQQRATSAMNQYEFNNRAINLVDDDVYFASDFDDLQAFLYPDDGSDCEAIRNSSLPSTVKREADAQSVAEQIRFVAVCMPAPARTGVFFAGSVLDNPLIRAKAIAGHSPPLTGICDSVAPMGLIDDINIPNDEEFSGTHTYTLREDPGDAVAPGNYQLLEVCDPGGRAVREALQGNCSGCVSIGDTIPSAPGVKAGPVRFGWNDRFDSDLVIGNPLTYQQYKDKYAEFIAATEANGSGFQPDSSVYNGGGTYGRRIIVTPIIVIDTDGDGDADGTGKENWEVTGLAAFFLQKKVPGGNGGEITAEFIEMLPVANGEYNEEDIPIPSLTKTVLYR